MSENLGSWNGGGDFKKKVKAIQVPLAKVPKGSQFKTGRKYVDKPELNTWYYLRKRRGRSHGKKVRDPTMA